MAKRPTFSYWLAEQRRTYLENATALRDFRVQMRGNRPMYMFGGYLAVLLVVTGFSYWNIYLMGRDVGSIADQQGALQAFYAIVIGCIAAMLFVITPALTATSVVNERARQSLDLVFCAPVEPKYFLVGKLMASYRYVWMLLFLSIPVTATCAILGGATWLDMGLNYLQLSLVGMMVTALSLCVSTIAKKPVGAILWSYLGSAGLLAALGTLGFAQPEGSALGAISPLSMLFSSANLVHLGPLVFPGFFVTIAITGLISKLFMHAAGNLLAPHNPKSARSLRLHALSYLWVVVGACGYAISATYSGGSSDFSNQAQYIGATAGIMLGWLLLPLASLMPIISCFSLDDERVHRPNGWFNFRKVLTGTPASSLPFIYLLIGGCFVALGIGARVSSHDFSWLRFAPYGVFITGFWTLMWAIGRAASVIRPTLKESRVVQFLAFIAIVALPAPFLAILQSWFHGPSEVYMSWQIMKPLLPVDSSPVGFTLFGAADIFWTFFVWAAGIGTFMWSESKMRDRKRYQLPHSIEAFDEIDQEPWLDVETSSTVSNEQPRQVDVRG